MIFSKVYKESQLFQSVYLVDVVTRYDVVEHGVEVVEQSDDLYRSTLRRQLSKADNIREVDGGVLSEDNCVKPTISEK